MQDVGGSIGSICRSIQKRKNGQTKKAMPLMRPQTTTHNSAMATKYENKERRFGGKQAITRQLWHALRRMLEM
jgi:hypothetical protein